MGKVHEVDARGAMCEAITQMKFSTSNSIKIITALLKHNPQLANDNLIPVYVQNFSPKSPLVYAIMLGHHDKSKKFVEQHPNQFKTLDYHLSPLHYLARLIYIFPKDAIKAALEWCEQQRADPSTPIGQWIKPSIDDVIAFIREKGPDLDLGSEAASPKAERKENYES